MKHEKTLSLVIQIKSPLQAPLGFWFSTVPPSRTPKKRNKGRGSTAKQRHRILFFFEIPSTMTRLSKIFDHPFLREAFATFLSKKINVPSHDLWTNHKLSVYNHWDLMRFRKGSILYIISYILKLILRLLSAPCYFFFPISYLLCVPVFYLTGFEVSCLIFLHYYPKLFYVFAGCEEMKDDNLKGHWSLRIIGCNCHLLTSIAIFLFDFFYRKINTSTVVISTYYVFNGAQNAFAAYLAFTKETSK